MKQSISKKWKTWLVAVVVILLCAVMCFTFAACGPEVEPEPTPPVITPSYLTESTVATVGSTTGVLEKEGTFYADYGTLDEEQAAARDHNVRLGEEGFVLLKNEGNVLPMTDAKYITLLGVNSYQLVYSTIGSGAGSTGNNGIALTTLRQSVEKAGFVVNNRVMELYELQRGAYPATEYRIPEIPMSYYTPTIQATYNGYNDAAIVTLSRIGAEGGDILTHDVEGYADKNKHGLMLDDNEVALIKHAKEHFDKVIVLINSSNVLQIPELAEAKTDDNLGVDAVLWIGNPGNNAQEAIGSILRGTVNPSGKTVEVWGKDFTEGPTWTNFGSNEQNKNPDGTRMDAYYYDESGADTGYRQVEYREGIYMGYRYYETLYADAAEADKDEAYSNVLYPFGYGLSYTTFDWELSTDIAPTADITAANQTVTIRVKVTNTGDVAGKDVVQVYSNPPYTEGGIEKAAANLMGFAKTDMLEPGESQTVQVRFAAQDLASFDWNDANKNDFKGYELEAGDYIISANRDSHTPVVSVKRTVKDTILCKTDLHTGATIEPVFVDNGGSFNYETVNSSLEDNMISRANGLTQPAPVSKEDRIMDNMTKQFYDAGATYRSHQDSPDDPWYVSEVPEGWTQAEAYDGELAMEIGDMAGVDYTAPTIEGGKVTLATDADSEKWDTFMNQLTWEDLWGLAQYGGGSEAIPEANVNRNSAVEGSIQLEGGTLWPCAPIMAATFNVELARKTGELIGNEAMFLGVTHWNGPGMNIHRSPLGGRNYEYYSQDGVHSARIAEAIVGGVASKGLTCYAKHMFLNDQETYRNIGGGVFTWVTEQAIREIYAKPFEAIAKQGHTTGYMSAFNRVGAVGAAVNYAMHYDLARYEWGYKGIFMTDLWMGNYAPLDLCVRAGDDHPLGTGTNTSSADLEKGTWDAAAGCVRVEAAEGNGTILSPTHYVSVRKAAQRVLWVYANTSANGNSLESVEAADMTFEYDCYSAQSVVVPGLDISSYALADGSTLPDGLSLASTGLLSGTPTEEGSYTVDLVVIADGWVHVTSSLTINVVNAIHDSGSDVTALKAGTAMETTFSTDYYAYNTEFTTANNPTGETFNNPTYPRLVLNWYKRGESDAHGVISRVDEASPPIPTIEEYIDPDAPTSVTADDLDAWIADNPDLANLYGYSYRVMEGSTTNSLPGTMKFEHVMGTTAGNNPDIANNVVECVTGYKLSGTPDRAGTWTVEITLNIPVVQGGQFICAFWTDNCYVIEYTRTITITVAA